MGVIKRFQGGLLGVLLPLFTALIALLWLSPDRLQYRLTTLITEQKLGAWLSLAAIVNLFLFFLYLRLQKDDQARGVLGATFFWAALSIVLKFIL